MEEEKKVSRILGFPWAVIIFLVIILAAYFGGTYFTYRQNKAVMKEVRAIQQVMLNEAALKAAPVVPAVVETPTATPVPEPTEKAKPKKTVDPEDLLGGAASSTTSTTHNSSSSSVSATQ